MTQKPLSLVPFGLMVAVAMTGCKPNNATVDEGRYMAYLATNTSPTLFQTELDFEGAETSFNIDCRDADDTVGDLLEDPLDICDRTWATLSSGTPVYVANEGWVGTDGYRAIGGPLEPWRGEAVITSEGDIQIAFHQRIPGGEDFRFLIVVDPNFQPRRCAQGASGETFAEDIDGDWLDNWSDDADSGMLFYLTNGAFQFDPSNTDDIWSLPQEWRSGGAWGRFGREDLRARPPYYATPQAYNDRAVDEFSGPSSSSLFRVLDIESGDDPETNSDYQRVIRRVEDIVEETNDEFEDIQAPITAQIHTNEWRAPDGSAAGLDGWVELHYSWIRFDDGATFDKGDPLSGDFNLLFDGVESQTRVAVSGSFTIDKLKKDRWVTDDVAAEKLEENGTVLCTNGTVPVESADD